MYQYFSVRNKSAYDSVKITFLGKGYGAFFFLKLPVYINQYIASYNEQGNKSTSKSPGDFFLSIS